MSIEAASKPNRIIDERGGRVARAIPPVCAWLGTAALQHAYCAKLPQAEFIAMHRSNRKFNIPPQATPRGFKLLNIGLLKFPPLEAKKPFKCPTNYYWNTSPQRQISFSIKRFIYTPFRERYAVMTPSKVFWRPFWKGYWLTKAKFYLVNPSNPAKTEKNSRAYYVRTRDKSALNSPPFQRNVQILRSPGTMHSQMPGVCRGGGNVEVSNWSAYKECVSLNSEFSDLRRKIQLWLW